MNIFIQLQPFWLKFENRLLQILNTKFWAVKVTLITLLISTFMAFPSLMNLEEGSTTPRARAVAMQMEDLHQFWSTQEPTNAMFRITVPLIASILGLRLQHTLILQIFTGVLIFYISAKLAERETGDRLLAFFITLLIGVIYPGTSAFLELRYYFDSFAYLFLLLALWFRSPILIFILTIFAAFTDERAVIAAGFVFIWWSIHQDQYYSKIKAFFNSKSFVVLFAVILYVISRSIIKNSYGIQTWSEDRGEFLFFDQINNIPMGLWTGLEFGWVLIILSFAVLFIKRNWFTLIIFAFIIAIQSIAALSVVDITRSMGYLLPSLFIALSILVKEKEEHLKHIVVTITLASLVFLNYGAGGKSSIWLFYPLPVQIIRWLLPS